MNTFILNNEPLFIQTGYLLSYFSFRAKLKFSDVTSYSLKSQALIKFYD